MTLKEIEEKLRLKIAQARKNGFDVVPYFSKYEYPGGGAVDVNARRCCIFGAASDLEADFSENLDPKVNLAWFSVSIEDGFEGFTVTNAEERLGRKLRRECLAYMKRKEEKAKRKSRG